MQKIETEKEIEKWELSTYSSCERVSIEELERFLKRTKAGGANHIEFYASINSWSGGDYDVWLSLTAYDVHAESDEEFQQRLAKEEADSINKQQRAYEDDQRKKAEQEERDRQEYQRLKAKFEKL